MYVCVYVCVCVFVYIYLYICFTLYLTIGLTNICTIYSTHMSFLEFLFQTAAML